VIRIAVSGRYICLVSKASEDGRIRKCPPRPWSSNDPKILGESKRGEQNQLIDPSVATRAAVCRSPIKPWSAMSG